MNRLRNILTTDAFYGEHCGSVNSLRCGNTKEQSIYEVKRVFLPPVSYERLQLTVETYQRI